MAIAATTTENEPTIERSPSSDMWDKRYKAEGFIWGEGPGPVAPILVGMFEQVSPERTINILDFGSGYGRSALYFAQKSFNVVGVDEFGEACRLALSFAKKLNGKVQGSSLFQCGGIEVCSPYPNGSFDAIFSHRVLHLLKARHVKAFAKQAARLLPPGGILCISARSPEDFNEEQMEWLRGQEGKTAVYRANKFPEREGQYLNFWDDGRYKKTFGDDFEISSVTDDVEMEAASNSGVYTRLKTMVAVRRSAPRRNSGPQ